MAAFSEVSAEQLRRLQQVIDQYSMLDDSLFTLQTELPRLKTIIDQYGGRIEDVLAGFVDPEVFGKLALDAQQQFYNALKTYIENGELEYRRTSIDSLLQSFNETYGTQVSRLVDTVTTNLFARAASFRSLAATAEIPLRRIADIEKYEITSVQINGVQYNHQQLSNIWQQMNDSYGQRDTIQFRNGRNYPMRSYVDSRANTTQAEAHRLVTIAEGSANGVYFGKVNRTGTTDSCMLHENEIFFLSEGARQEALARWPDIEILRRMKTWDEIKSDGTHMGGFGCKHIVRAVSIQFFSDARFQEALAANPPSSIPKKIDERKIFEDATGRKFISPTSKPQKSYEPVPTRVPVNPRYTIA